MTFRALAVVSILALLSSCTSPSGSIADAAAQASAGGPRKASEAERADCSARGGAIVARGMLGSATCAVPYADAGKVCRDKSDCQGECRATAGAGASPIRQGDTVVGRCDADSQAGFGCFSLVSNGRAAQPEICVD